MPVFVLVSNATKPSLQMLQETANLATFTEEMLNGKLYFSVVSIIFFKVAPLTNDNC